jgi:cold shock CspA family protein
MKGKVKFFNKAKDFGFIVSEEDGKEYYFNSSNLALPYEKDSVEFTPFVSQKGNTAKAVKVLRSGKKGSTAWGKIILSLVIGLVIGYFSHKI